MYGCDHDMTSDEYFCNEEILGAYNALELVVAKWGRSAELSPTIYPELSLP